MKTAAQNRSANSDGSVIARGPTFSLVNALVYVRHRPGHSPGKNTYNALLGVGWTILRNGFHGAVRLREHRRF